MIDGLESGICSPDDLREKLGFDNLLSIDFFTTFCIIFV